MAVEALQALVEYAATGDVDAAERVAAIEKRGDRLRERNLATLNRAFTTMFDRDLTAVAIRRIDDVANYAKTTVREMGLLAMEPDATVLAIAELLSAGAVELRAAVAALGGDPPAGPGARRARPQGRAAGGEDLPRRLRRALRSGTPARDGVRGIRSSALLDALRRREVYRHLSNAADRLDGAGRVIMDIAVATA